MPEKDGDATTDPEWKVEVPEDLEKHGLLWPGILTVNMVKMKIID